MVVPTQIYCRCASLGEVSALLDLGVELIAWDVRPEDGNGLIRSRWIADLVRSRGAQSTLLVHSRKVATLSAVARMVGPDWLLLSSDRDDAAMPALAKQLAPIRLMMSVPLRPAGSTIEMKSIALARQYADFAGALILDTCPDPDNTTRFGCTGRTNDWSQAAEIVRSVAIPVVLAGGLNADNVASGIAAVKPWGVDACTSLELPDKSKDLARCRDFMQAVRGGA